MTIQKSYKLFINNNKSKKVSIIIKVFLLACNISNLLKHIYNLSMYFNKPYILRGEWCGDV